MKNIILGLLLTLTFAGNLQAAVKLRCEGTGTSKKSTGNGTLQDTAFVVTIAKASKTSLYGIIVNMTDTNTNESEVLIASNGYVKPDTDYSPKKYAGYSRFVLIDSADWVQVELLVSPEALEQRNPELVMLVHMNQSGGTVKLKCTSKDL